MRVWVEEDAPPPLRARITAAADLSSPEQTITAAAGVESIVAVVREWLERFALSDG